MSKLRPKYIFHYTSIETLALILKNRSIRLNRLDKLNDLTEPFSTEGPLGKYIFVTCWTSQQDEKIPLWVMYGHGLRGVRIGLPTDFMKLHDVREAIYHAGQFTETGGTFSAIVPENVLRESNYLISNFRENTFFPIEYTDDQNKLLPKVFHQRDDGALTVALDNLGRHKPTAWSFEEEWRFKLIIHPYGIMEIDPGNISPTRKALESQKELTFSDYYLEIADDAYSEMSIMLGPRCTENEKIIVEALLKKHNPGAKLCTSSLKIR